MVDLNVDATFVSGIAASMERASAPLNFGGDLSRGSGSTVLGSDAVAGALNESTSLRGSRAEMAATTTAGLGRQATDFVSQLRAADARLAAQSQNRRIPL